MSYLAFLNKRQRQHITKNVYFTGTYFRLSLPDKHGLALNAISHPVYARRQESEVCEESVALTH